MEAEIRGVAVIVVNPKGQIVLLTEYDDKPQFGKFAGMRSIPMETVESGESDYAALARLIKEELPGLPTQLAGDAQMWGNYCVVPAVWVRLFVIYLDREWDLSRLGSEEVGDHTWFELGDARQEWLRRGALEMITDFGNERSEAVRHVCAVPRSQNPAPSLAACAAV